MLVGLGKLDQTFPAFDIVFKELDVLGCIRIANEWVLRTLIFSLQIMIFNFSYPTALNLVASGRINVLQTVSHRFSLEDAIKAYVTAKENPTTALKVVIYPNEE